MNCNASANFSVPNKPSLCRYVKYVIKAFMFGKKIIGVQNLKKNMQRSVNFFQNISNRCLYIWTKLGIL